MSVKTFLDRAYSNLGTGPSVAIPIVFALSFGMFGLIFSFVPPRPEVKDTVEFFARSIKAMFYYSMFPGFTVSLCFLIYYMKGHVLLKWQKEVAVLSVIPGASAGVVFFHGTFILISIIVYLVKNTVCKIQRIHEGNRYLLEQKAKQAS